MEKKFKSIQFTGCLCQERSYNAFTYGPLIGICNFLILFFSAKDSKNIANKRKIEKQEAKRKEAFKKNQSKHFGKITKDFAMIGETLERVKQALNEPLYFQDYHEYLAKTNSFQKSES